MDPVSTLLPSPTAPTAAQAIAETTAPLSIVVVFADTILARKSAQIYNDLIAQFAPDGVFTASWWDFNRLREPTLFSAATRATNTADIIIVAAYATAEIPEVVKAWIDMAIEKRAGDERILIGLLGLATDLQPGDSPVNQYLQAAAREAGMEYLLHWSTLLAPRLNGSLENIEGRQNKITPLRAEILAHATATPHGGIND